MMPQRSDLVRVKCVFVYTEGFAGAPAVALPPQGLRQRPLGGASADLGAATATATATATAGGVGTAPRDPPKARTNLCALLIVAYVVMMVAVGIAQNRSGWLALRRSLQVYF
jgi:hypothetical protein